MNKQLMYLAILVVGVVVGVLFTLFYLSKTTKNNFKDINITPIQAIIPIEDSLPTNNNLPSRAIQPTVSYITPTLTPATPTPNTNEQIVDSLSIFTVIKDFETAIINREVDKLLSMFTAPSLPGEIDSYNSMRGLDAAGPRLFNTAGSNFRIDAWKIINIDYGNSADFEIRAVVDEQRRGWNPVMGGYDKPVESRMFIELAKVNGKLKITNYYYYWGDAGGGSAKYRGLGF